MVARVYADCGAWWIEPVQIMAARIIAACSAHYGWGSG